MLLVLVVGNFEWYIVINGHYLGADERASQRRNLGLLRFVQHKM